MKLSFSMKIKIKNLRKRLRLGLANPLVTLEIFSLNVKFIMSNFNVNFT